MLRRFTGCVGAGTALLFVFPALLGFAGGLADAGVRANRLFGIQFTALGALGLGNALLIGYRLDTRRTGRIACYAANGVAAVYAASALLGGAFRSPPDLLLWLAVLTSAVFTNVTSLVTHGVERPNRG